MPDAATPITEAIALRIGLAARALPDVEPQRLVQVLLDALKGEAPTPSNLQSLTVRRLKEAKDGALSDQPSEQLKEAVAYLRGERAITEIADNLPTPEPYADGDLPGSVRVAVASNAGESLDGHFGTCARFLIYQVSPAACRLIAFAAPKTPAPWKRTRTTCAPNRSPIATCSTSSPSAAPPPPRWCAAMSTR
jgi:hypothetical protein